MTNWTLMFEAVQKIVQSSTDFSESMEKVVKFAQQHPQEYNNADYWQKIVVSELPLDTLKAWAREGFENLQLVDDWSLVILDCGDCPDIFRLSIIRIADEISLDDFTSFARQSALRYADDFPKSFFDAQRDIKLIDHHINELQHPVIRYDRCDSNSYLLWLSVASLVLRESLTDEAFCKRILQGRSRIVVMSGFEEIFFYVGSISEEGLQS